MIAASLLIAGPNPAHAVADKNGSGSHSKHDSRKNGSHGHDRSFQKRVSDWVNDAFDADRGRKPGKPDSAPPLMDPGTSGGDLGELGALTVDAPVALRSAAAAVVPEPPTPTGINASGAASKSSGSDYAGPAVTAFQSPRVVVGNGRTPGQRSAASGPAPEAVYTADSAPVPEAMPEVPAPEAVEITIPSLPPPLPSIEKIRPVDFVIGEFGTARVDKMTDPLAGAAGLILIPAIGALLGYRQARAAQSVRESTRT
ncbi:hypothetical protein CQY20_03490 [Mycolicibacterium agri]|uniref:Uncharacterized protein n=1 Tax=Mycolicibacterium agri TaxID=36811 RepID=A0A2A7NER5_MYCAG|nr:hypothetical protein [Mycolicibacterium agri]PEG41958.1 hypothetical protein CQY20_03490 [Mycolicibacterium agri]